MRHILCILLVLSLLLCFMVPTLFAENIDPDIMFEEGQRYLASGDTSAQDFVKGISLIVTAANSGSAKAMVEMGLLYSSGLGKLLSEDFEEGTQADLALSWYVKAAEAGEPELAASAISSDAFSYFLGSTDGSIQEDDAVALKYFEKAAEYGDASAINMMVAFYTYGFGVDQDAEKALELGTLLAEKGDKEALLAMEEYAYAYYSGTKDGIDINFNTSFQYYLKLADLGVERAMYNVGLLYEYGLGITANHDKAVEWLSKAKDAGYEPAGDMLTKLTSDQ